MEMEKLKTPCHLFVQRSFSFSLARSHTHTHTLIIFFVSSFRLCVFATTANVTATMLLHTTSFLLAADATAADSLSPSLTQFPSLPTYLYVVHTIPNFFLLYYLHTSEKNLITKLQ